MNEGTIGFPLGITSENLGSSFKPGLKNGLLTYPRRDSGEVAEYVYNITAASGALQPGDVPLLNKLVTSQKAAGLWGKILEQGLFLGGFNGSSVKLKYAHPDYKTLLYNTNFVSGDYGETTGLTAAVANRKADTRIIPSIYGLSKDNFSAGCFSLSKVGNDVDYGGIMDNKSSGAFQFNIQKESIYLNSPTVRVQGFPRIPAGHHSFLWVTSNGNINLGQNYLYAYSNGVAPPNILFDSPLSLFGGRNTSNVFGTNRVGYYFIAPYLTVSEIHDLYAIVKDFLVSKGRVTEAQECVTFGDSITFGTGASAYTNRYSYILANNFGLRERNLGIVSSFLNASFPTVVGGYDRRKILIKHNIYNGGKVIIQYGVNDCNADANINGNPIIITDYTNKLTTIANELKSEGISPANIQIGSISYLNNGTSTTKMEAYRDGAYNAAVNAGVKFVDVYAYMRDNGAGTLIGDTVHPNDTGHAAIAYAHTNLAVFVP